MRIAICFSTQIRTGVHVSKNIKNYIGDLYKNCDFFVHFWDVNTISQNDLNSFKLDNDAHSQYKNIPTKVDSQNFTDFYNQYAPISMIVEPYFVTTHIPIAGGRRYNNKTKSNVISLFESIYECNNLKLNYEKKYNFEYDYVVRLRPDLVIHPEKSLEKDLTELNNDNSILFAGHKNRQYLGFMEDIFWISKSNIMDKITLFYEYESKTNLNKEDIFYNWQSVMYEWVNNELGIKPIQIVNSTMCPYYVSDLQMNADIMGTEIYTRQY